MWQCLMLRLKFNPTGAERERERKTTQSFTRLLQILDFQFKILNCLLVPILQGASQMD